MNRPVQIGDDSVSGSHTAGAGPATDDLSRGGAPSQSSMQKHAGGGLVRLLARADGRFWRMGGASSKPRARARGKRSGSAPARQKKAMKSKKADEGDDFSPPFRIIRVGPRRVGLPKSCRSKRARQGVLVGALEARGFPTRSTSAAPATRPSRKPAKRQERALRSHGADGQRSRLRIKTANRAAKKRFAVRVKKGGFTGNLERVPDFQGQFV
jgi:hypothetical protein